MGDTAQRLHRFAHEAMTVTFEAVIAHTDDVQAGQAAMAAFEEVDRLERLLSRFDACSDIAQVNRLEPGQCVGVDVAVFECLETAARVWHGTRGAFDVTVGAVMQYKEVDNVPLPRRPDESLDDALARVGMERLVLDRDGFLVGLRPAEEGGPTGRVSVDLGAIGKGFALDKMLDVFADWDIRNALVHGGTSTARVIGSGGPAAGCPAGVDGWAVAVGGPWAHTAGIEKVVLSSGAVSGSGTQARGEHIIDPQSGLAPDGPLAAWVICRTGAVADALSTAMMVMSMDEIESYCQTHGDVAVLAVVPDEAVGPEGKVLMLGADESDYFKIF